MSIFEENKLQNTSVSELGEFGLIEHITKSFECKNKSSKKGVGDDCCCIRVFQRKISVIKYGYVNRRSSF